MKIRSLMLACVAAASLALTGFSAMAFDDGGGGMVIHPGNHANSIILDATAGIVQGDSLFYVDPTLNVADVCLYVTNLPGGEPEPEPPAPAPEPPVQEPGGGDDSGGTGQGYCGPAHYYLS